MSNSVLGSQAEMQTTNNFVSITVQQHLFLGKKAAVVKMVKVTEKIANKLKRMKLQEQYLQQ